MDKGSNKESLSLFKTNYPYWKARFPNLINRLSRI